MCGVCGKTVDTGQLASDDISVVRQMMEALAHRGPDGSGQESFPSASLGHVRLAIIDLAGGAQPMCNAGRTVCVSYNGEIYNFLELREQLEKLGHRFRTQSDTEVIIHAYEQYGDQCVRRFRGMFAFALWDEEKHKLLLARDRLGQKPLVYAKTSRGLVFASESGALLRDPEVSSEMDPDGLSQYLRWGFITAPASIYRQVRKLPPAHIAVHQRGQLRIERYWQLEFTHDGPKKVGPALEALEEVVEEAVRLRMVADVPIGAFLSGGVDSSLVVGMMARNTDRPVRTFCIGFRDEDLDERQYASEAAEVLGTEHQVLEMPEVSPELVQRIARQYSEPFSDSSALPTFILSELTRRRVTVALNGDGGDELFGGYGRYYHIRGLPMPWDSSRGARRAIMRMLPEAVYPHVFGAASGLLRLVGRVLPSASDAAGGAVRLARPLEYRYWEHREIFGNGGIESVLTPDGSASVSAPSYPSAVIDALRSTTVDSLAAIQHADIVGTLAHLLIPKVEIASMAFGLECRSPLLDHKVVEFAASLPPRLRAHPEASKYLLKELAVRYVPRRVFERRKQGFTAPVPRWLDRSLEGLVSDYLLNGETSRSGLFRSEAVRHLLSDRNGAPDWHKPVWRLLLFELWYDQRLM